MLCYVMCCDVVWCGVMICVVFNFYVWWFRMMVYLRGGGVWWIKGRDILFWKTDYTELYFPFYQLLHHCTEVKFQSSRCCILFVSSVNFHPFLTWHLINTNPCNSISLSTPVSASDSVPSKRIIAIIAGTISGFLVLLALAAIVYCLYGKPLKKKIPTSAVPSSMIENENKDGSVDPRNVSEVAGRDKF